MRCWHSLLSDSCVFCMCVVAPTTFATLNERGFDEFGRWSSWYWWFTSLFNHASSFYFSSKLLVLLLKIHLCGKRSGAILACAVYKRIFQETGWCHPAFCKSLYFIHIQWFMDMRRLNAFKDKTYAWCDGHHTIVHWPLQHCSLADEALFFGP